MPPRDQLGLCIDVGEKLGSEPALAHTRLADDRDQLDGALLRGSLECPDQERLLELATDERRLVAASAVPSEPVADGVRLPEQKRARLPLHGHRRERLVLEYVAGRPVGLLADRDAIDGRHGLDASSGIDDITGDEPFTPLGTSADRDNRLACVDAYSHLEPELGICLVQFGDRFQDAQPRAHRSFGVVLVSDRSTTDRHHRVTDELLNRAAVTLDLRRKRAWYGRIRARTSSGSCCSDAAVKPTRSQKRTETIFRSSSTAVGCSVSGAVQ